MGTWIHIFFSTFLLAVTYAAADDAARDPKLISVFQVVKFKNDVCKATSAKNGTCYTSQECSNIGGSSSGSCADGFGVCCVMTLTAGGSSSLNNTYIVQTTFVAPSQKYKICPCDDNICRVKLDFNTFTLTGPITGVGSVVTAGTPPSTTDISIAESVGDCVTDTFQVLPPSGRATPVICGSNPNQHMYVDMSGDECAEVVIGIGATTSTTRSLDITVTQYHCGDHDVAGPPGCLQYFPNTTGKFRSFNFPDLGHGATVTYENVHLSSQNYEVCIRRGNAMKYICYMPCTSTIGTTESAGGKLDTQNSFGISIPNVGSIVSSSAHATSCATDYLFIPYNNYVVAEMAIASENYQTYNSPTIIRDMRICGSAMNSDAEAGASVSICTFAVPFNVGVYTDQDEICSANSNANTCEFTGTIAAASGAGILGFNICYAQT